MKKLKKDTQRFLLDTNVFIAAIKNPKKETKTLLLIKEIIENENIQLVGDVFIIEEMIKYAEKFQSETSLEILSALLSKIELFEVSENYIKICKNYIKTPNLADIIHAATCLKADAILISNDTHFNNIRNEGIIKVWSITKMIKQFL
jgi:predicted nucleic acid-binding protein